MVYVRERRDAQIDVRMCDCSWFATLHVLPRPSLLFSLACSRPAFILGRGPDLLFVCDLPHLRGTYFDKMRTWFSLSR